MRFDILTLFPQFFESPLRASILGRAMGSGTLEVWLHDFREFADDKHRMADDTPFGGGAGMVLKAEPVARCLESLLNFRAAFEKPPCRVIYLTPQGRTLNQQMVESLARETRLVLLCGHYEGVDERVVETCVTDEISLGDFVLTGGESAALVLLEAITRFVPGVLGNQNSASGDSFANGLLEAPPFTKPATWREMAIPPVLLSGNHGEIARWRFLESVRRTAARRPDLLDEKTIEEALEALAPSKRQKKELARRVREIVDAPQTNARETLQENSVQAPNRAFTSAIGEEKQR